MDDRMLKPFNKQWAVVGFDYERVLDIINDIQAKCGKEVYRKIKNKQELRVEFTDGTALWWVKPSCCSHGRKFGKMWCDKEIDENIFSR